MLPNTTVWSFVCAFALLSGCQEEGTAGPDGGELDASTPTDSAVAAQDSSVADTSPPPPDAVADAAVDTRSPEPTCVPGRLNRLESPDALVPAERSLILDGSGGRLELGVTQQFSGIGVSLRVGGSRLTSNLIEARSGAGAAHQITAAGTIDGQRWLMNQAAGNSAGHQWGYETCFDQSPTQLTGTNWVPMPNEESDGVPASPFLTGDQQSRSLLEGRPSWEVEARGPLMVVTKSWTIRNPGPTAVTFENWSVWDAFYTRVQFAIEHEMRVRYAFANGASSRVVPFLPFGQTPEGSPLANRLYDVPGASFSYEFNPNFGGWYVIHTNTGVAAPLRALTYSFDHEDELWAVVVRPAMEGRSTFGYESRVYPEQDGENIGSLLHFLVFEDLPRRTWAPGEMQTYSIEYVAGRIDDLEAAGYEVGSVDRNDCSMCVASSCEEACRRAAGTPGACGVDGSTDTSQCCACF